MRAKTYDFRGDGAGQNPRFPRSFERRSGLNRVWRTVLTHLAVFAALAAFVAVLIAFEIGCPIRRITGLPCPGCGMFRAAVAFLSGDFALSFRLHPLLIPAGIGLMALFHAGPLRLTKRAKNAVAFALGGLFLAVYIARLGLHAIP